jgi:hypothetical protein
MHLFSMSLLFSLFLVQTYYCALRYYHPATVKVQSGQSTLLFIYNYSDVHFKTFRPIQQAHMPNKFVLRATTSLRATVSLTLSCAETEFSTSISGVCPCQGQAFKAMPFFSLEPLTTPQ